MRILFIFFGLLLLSSCSKLGLEKRRYRPGYYSESFAKTQPVPQNTVSENTTNKNDEYLLGTKINETIVETKVDVKDENSTIENRKTKSSSPVSNVKSKLNYLSKNNEKENKTNEIKQENCSYTVQSSYRNDRRSNHGLGFLLLLFLVFIFIVFKFILPLIALVFTLLIALCLVLLLILLWALLFRRR